MAKLTRPENCLPLSPVKRLTENESAETFVLRKKTLWALIFGALLIRGTVLATGYPSLRQDPDAYQAIAATLSSKGVFGLTAPDGQVIPTSFRPPLYPAILALFVLNDDETPDLRLIGLFHLAVSLLTCLFIYRAAQYALKNFADDRQVERLSLIAGFLIVLDPILIQQSTFVMTETIAAMLTSMIFWLIIKQHRNGWTWRASCILGIGFSLAYLCRPTFLAWAAIYLVGELAVTLKVKHKSSSEKGCNPIFKVSSIILIILITVSLWTNRNRIATGHASWSTTHGGYTLLLGNNPSFYQHLESGGMLSRWDAKQFTEAYAYRFGEDGRSEDFWLQDRGKSQMPAAPRSGLTEYEDDRWSYEAAVATIKRSPKTFIQSCVNRFYRLWTPFPFASPERSNTKRLAIAFYYLMLYLAAITGVAKLVKQGNWEILWPVLSLVLTLSLVHLFYWSNLRMRAPAIPLIAICAAAALTPKICPKKQAHYVVNA